MGTTAQGLRYPEPTDPTTNGATAIRNLAEDVDSGLATALQPSGLLAVTPRFSHSQTQQAWQSAAGSGVTFTVPASGDVLVRQSGLLFTNQATDFGVLFGVGIGAPDFSAGADLSLGTGHGSAVNVAYLLTLTSGASVTLTSYLTTSTWPAGFTWYGHVEVWAAP